MFRQALFAAVGMAASTLVSVDYAFAQNWAPTRQYPSATYQSSNDRCANDRSANDAPRNPSRGHAVAPAGDLSATRYETVAYYPREASGAPGAATQFCRCTPEDCAAGRCPPGCRCCSATGTCRCGCRPGECTCVQCPPGCSCERCRSANNANSTSLRPVARSNQQAGRASSEMSAAVVIHSTMRRPSFPDSDADENLAAAPRSGSRYQ